MFGWVIEPFLHPLRAAMEPQPIYMRSIIMSLITLAVSMLTEVVNYYLLYRKESYKSIVAQMERHREKMEREKAQLEGKAKMDARKREKIVEGLENTYKAMGVDLQKEKIGSQIASAFVFLSVLGAFSNVFEGLVMGKLPFVPFGFIQGMSHRGLSGEDYTECNYLFIYVVASMITRPLVQHLFGVAPKRGVEEPSMFTMPKPE
eukprot:comp8294_c0_seq1/m.3698 comp8294_c0_seq1/g.3698  ORF comp8294_c0_seq1/g.3698 comp8294_c0_seq1/m.3698 type:complete len:204 (-) comp8294_c0_seq1:265-876(-)